MSWKEDLYEYEIQQIMDLDDLAEQSTEANRDDVGFVNPKSGAGILGRKNGMLEGFADYGLGFRFSPESQSLMVFASSIHFFAGQIVHHDTEIRNTYLKDEYGDIFDILQELDVQEKLTEEVDHDHEEL